MEKLIIICPLILISGILDAIVGSGALISLPAYMASGLPVHYAYGTNKFASFLGTFTSAIRYIHSKKVDIRTLGLFVVLCMVGSTIGSRITLYLNDVYLKYILIVILPILIFFLVIKKKDVDLLESKNTEEISKPKRMLYSIFFGLLMGIYGGFLGVGTTSFLILIFINIFRNRFYQSLWKCTNCKLCVKFGSNAYLFIFWENHVSNCNSSGYLFDDRKLYWCRACYQKGK